MRGKLLIFLTALLCSSSAIYAQCGIVETISVCDMTVVDGSMDGTPDGIVNLFDAYNAIVGVTPIAPADGSWFDPGFNFALDDTTGDLFTWDLDSASEAVTDYQFEFINTSAGCTDDIQITLNVVLGPFAGTPLPPSGPNAANVSICEAVVSSFDLFQVFESLPSPHVNGTWAFLGNDGDPSNFISLSQAGVFQAQIPYEPGGNLIDFDIFEFSYTVDGIAPCATSSVSTFKVEVIRDVDAGVASSFDICESELRAGVYDADIDLIDDLYLSGEDIEGTWSSITDPTGQISNPGDSVINLREVYDFLSAANPRFGCVTFDYTYTVEARTNLAGCDDQIATVSFTFYEEVRPFSQPASLDLCIDELPATVNLYDEIVFATQGVTTFDYPNENCTNWSFVSGPSDLGLQSNDAVNPVSGLPDWCSAFIPGTGFTTPYRTEGTVDMTGAVEGTYIFEYTVLPSYNCSDNTFGCTTDGTCTMHPCSLETTQVVLTINPINYAGEDTADIEFCEVDVPTPLDLVTLLTTNGVDTIHTGAMGTWEDLDTGLAVTNPFTLPTITDQQVFNFQYNTTTAFGCTDEATLTFTVFEQYSAGDDGTIGVCPNDGPVNLFDLLTGDPNNNGTWTGPGGYTSATNDGPFDPTVNVEGDYIYTVPANGLCTEDTATVTVSILPTNYPGEDTGGVELCIDAIVNPIGLITLLATNGVDTIYTGPLGDWVDNDTGNPIVNPFTVPTITGSQVFNFTYNTTTADGCTDQATLMFTVYEQFSAGTGGNLDICPDGVTLDLFDSLTGMPDTNGTWSGPDGYTTTTSSAPFDPTINVEGDYIYTVPSNGVCGEGQATVTVVFFPFNYAGEDTAGVELCFDTITNPIDLTTLLTTNGVDTIFTGGDWTDLDTGLVVTNPFTIPIITGSQSFNFQYDTTTANGCNDQSTLSFTVYELGNAGTDAIVEICPDGAPIDLFDSLGGMPDTDGTWIGPDGYTSATNNAPFDPAVNVEGDYIYTVPSNGACDDAHGTVTVTFFPINYAGEDTIGVEVCDADAASVDLITLLDDNGVDTIFTGGVWTDLATGLVVTNPFTIPTITGSQSFNFQYDTTTANGCNDQSTLSFTVFEQGDAGTGATVNICPDGTAIDLFDSITGTPDTDGTWTGPAGYTSATNNAPFDPAVNVEGDYIYTVPSNGACNDGTVTVSVTFFEINYAGEDTTSVEVCDADAASVDLVTLLDDNGVDTIFTGGIWTDLDTGLVVTNPFTIPTITGSQAFNFQYDTTTANGCNDQSTLSFTVFESGDAGVGASLQLCRDQGVVNIFDELTGTPDTTGTWTGPDGYTATGTGATIDTSIAVSGDYIYEVAANGPCAAVSATISVTISELPNAGIDVNTFVCPGDYVLDLTTLLDTSSELGGEFVDLATGLAVTDSTVNVGALGAGDFSYVYTVSNGSCPDDSIMIDFSITPVAAPIVSADAFCINEGITLGDLQVDNAINFAWYASAEANDELPLTTVLVNGEDYFVSNIDANGCESLRSQYVANILPFSDSSCDDGIPNGVSDNDDGKNDVLELGNLPIAFPNFEIKIFNRYGSVVYEGNQSTPLFKGDSNTGITFGKKLPTGVYFYIFSPNDGGVSEPFDGNFYLSR